MRNVGQNLVAEAIFAYYPMVMSGPSSEFEYDLFLSHSSVDKNRVRAIAEHLKGEGFRVWFDEWSIKPGDDIYMTVEKGLEVSRNLLLCISHSALTSDWVEMERSTALFRNPANKGRRLIPLLLADCKIPDAIKRYKYLDFRKDDRLPLDELVACLRELRGDSSPSADGSKESAPTSLLREVVRTRTNESRRIKIDFESEAKKYHDIKLSVFFIIKGEKPEDRKFDPSNHAIALWQYLGSSQDPGVLGSFVPERFNQFGMTGTDLSAFAVIEGKELRLFQQMGTRAGSLLPDEVAHEFTLEIGGRFIEALNRQGKPIYVSNTNPLAKWVNLLLMTTSAAHPERFRTPVLAVDPFVASLTIFDMFDLG